MTAARHGYRIVSIVAAATALNWAALNQWGHAAASTLIAAAAYLAAEHLPR